MRWFSPNNGLQWTHRSSGKNGVLKLRLWWPPPLCATEAGRYTAIRNAGVSTSNWREHETTKRKND